MASSQAMKQSSLDLNLSIKKTRKLTQRFLHRSGC